VATNVACSCSVSEPVTGDSCTSFICPPLVPNQSSPLLTGWQIALIVVGGILVIGIVVVVVVVLIKRKGNNYEQIPDR